MLVAPDPFTPGRHQLTNYRLIPLRKPRLSLSQMTPLASSSYTSMSLTMCKTWHGMAACKDYLLDNSSTNREGGSRTFYQMRIDRLRNIEIAKRNRERLKDPSFFPSVPTGNP